MLLPENDYQITSLTDWFYRDYPSPPYTEILKKMNRAYNCLLFQTHYDYIICIPYRSEITHPYAYHFKYSKRSLKHQSGLDYTKIVIVNNTKYINPYNAIIDNDEFNETIRNIEKIKSEALGFVEEYVAHVVGQKLMHPSEFRRRYAYSPLCYFHVKLGIDGWK